MAEPVKTWLPRAWHLIRHLTDRKERADEARHEPAWHKQPASPLTNFLHWPPSLPTKDPLLLAAHRHCLFSGISYCARPQISQQLRFSSWKNRVLSLCSVTLRAHAGQHTLLGNTLSKRPTHWECSREGSLVVVVGADRRAFLQMCPPISADRVINMVVTGSSQHIVFPLHQKEKKKKGKNVSASHHFLRKVNLLVYSFPNLRELNIFFGHKYGAGLPPRVNRGAKQRRIE